MNIKSIPVILAGVMFAACPPAMWGEERVPAVAPAMAAHALKLIGLDKAGVVVDAIELKREDHFLPFGPEHDTILRIHVSHFNFGERDGKEIHANPYIHGLNIYYSEALGQVVKIISDLPKGVKVQQPFPPVMAQEKALKQQKEIYTWSALPAPRVKLIEALESADRASGAKQILVYYTRSWGNFYGAKKVPVWEIYERGLPPTIGPWPPPGPTKKEIAEIMAGEDDWVATINATTGKGAGFGTSLF